MSRTSIALDVSTKAKLDEHMRPGDSYNDVVERLASGDVPEPVMTEDDVERIAERVVDERLSHTDADS